MMGNHLGTDELYKRTRLRILDMNDYLERDQLRRQNDAVVRLTVEKRLAEFLEALADERLTKRDKLNTLFTIWKKERRTSRHA